MYRMQEIRLYGLVKKKFGKLLNNSSLENQPFTVRPSNCKFKFSGQPQLAQKIINDGVISYSKNESSLSVP